MKPDQIARFAPHYAHEERIVESPEMMALHTACTAFDALVGELGELRPADGYIEQYLKGYLTLTASEAFFVSRIMPVHDTAIVGGRVLHSRFIVIDARNAFAEFDASNAHPGERQRAYFLMLNASDATEEPNEIFPFYVSGRVDVRPGSGYDDTGLTISQRQVFYARPWNDPLNIHISPQPIHDMEPYAAMAVEFQQAVEALAKPVVA